MTPFWEGGAFRSYVVSFWFSYPLMFPLACTAPSPFITAAPPTLLTGLEGENATVGGLVLAAEVSTKEGPIRRTGQSSCSCLCCWRLRRYHRKRTKKIKRRTTPMNPPTAMLAMVPAESPPPPALEAVCGFIDVRFRGPPLNNNPGVKSSTGRMGELTRTERQTHLQQLRTVLVLGFRSHCRSKKRSDGGSHCY
jgi:hypothetical protein